MNLDTDIQHQAYVLMPGETEPPAGILEGFRQSGRMQDMVLENLREGRSGNEVSQLCDASMNAEGIDGDVNKKMRVAGVGRDGQRG